MLGVAVAIQIATSVVAASLQVLLPIVKNEFHLSFAEAGVLVNFAFAGTFLTIALAGWAVDKLGDRAILLFGGIVTGAAGVACILAPNLEVLLGILVIMGFGLAMGIPAGSIAVRTAFSVQQRGTAMGVRQTGVPIGNFICTLALPSIALAVGWRGAIAAAGVVSILVASAGLAIYRTGGGRGHRFEAHNLRGVVNRDLTLAAISGMLLLAGQACLLTYLIAYLIQDRRLAITIAALFLGLAQLTGAFARVAWGTVSDRLLSGRRRIPLMLAGCVGGIGCVMLGTLPESTPGPLVVVAILLCATGVVGWNGVQMSFFTELAKPGAEGRSVGFGQMIQMPGSIVGPFVFGLIVDRTGSFRPAWLALALLLGVSALIMTATREEFRAVQREAL